jgi:hypothetical protein
VASGQEKSKENLQAFLLWVSLKSQEDFRQIVHRGGLNKREIAIECGFARSAVDQNPAIRKALLELEERLRNEGVLPNKEELTSVPIRMTSDRKMEMGLERLRQLETENALLRAEVLELKTKLSSFAVLAEVLAETGRVPR